MLGCAAAVRLNTQINTTAINTSTQRHVDANLGSRDNLDLAVCPLCGARESIIRTIPALLFISQCNHRIVFGRALGGKQPKNQSDTKGD